MLKLSLFALAFLCAASFSSAGDCGSSTFQLSKFQNVYIFNWMCKNAASPDLKKLCGAQPKPAPKPGNKQYCFPEKIEMG
jgi:hypothetical protein